MWETFLFLRQNSKVKTKNDGWHVGCKRKGRREARSFRKGSLPGTGSLKLQRSIATSRQRTGQDDRLAAAGVYLLTRCVVPAKAGNSRFETGFLVRARVALRNSRARRGGVFKAKLKSENPK